MSGFGKRYSAFDRFQQRHRWLGFPIAVLLKYADDQGGYLAATITYYGFLAIFPLLLLLTTATGRSSWGRTTTTCSGCSTRTTRPRT